MKKVYVGNLGPLITDAEIKTAFAPFGEVQNITLVLGASGKARGFGFLEMENDEQAAAAIAGMNGKELNGRALKVNDARPQKIRSGPPSRQYSDGPRRW
ncbi:MAG TPA: RNA-binding protein [Phycisphaerae bacterium]|jgi:RNA recognition motif-containing protein